MEKLSWALQPEFSHVFLATFWFLKCISVSTNSEVRPGLES